MTDDKDKVTFILPLGKRLLLFLCATVFCFLLANIFNSVLIYFKGVTPAVMRISTVIQDVIAFVLPAVLTAVLITRLPARFLCIDKGPRFVALVKSCLVLVVSIPAMNAIVVWNESIALPESLAGIERWMTEHEESAKAMIEMVLGGKGVGTLILSIAIVGVLAGLSEEIFFRGTFQRLLSTGGLNIHAAIWIVAFIFSASHLQFYGFFGRLLLGAYFGYLMYWTKCLWVPVITHIINNTLYIVSQYAVGQDASGVDFNTVGTGNVWLIILSVILTAIGIMSLSGKSLVRCKGR